MLSHFFAESVTWCSFLISWTCVDALKGNVISLPIKKYNCHTAARAFCFQSTLAWCAFAHSIFHFQLRCQHEPILFILHIWSSVLWGGFLPCSSSSFSSCMLWGPVSSGMRSVVKWEKSSIGAGLDCPHFMPSATEELLLGKGRACLPPPSWGLKAGRMTLNVAERVVARKW